METINARKVVEQPVVTNDDKSQAGSTEGVFADGVEAFLEGFATQVDHIGRMSKLVMKIEHCQQQLQAKMLAMGAANDL
jgi:hypothetical protein